ncbi:AAA family ATPase [Bacillus suaedae]|uniref:Nuclease SbcCD subunit C n=1 Tax=Halalkalibacter suaedae TaxID=2822140 RepID=A0A940WT16_9BACI|nr:AAA family ATPase [Bacillus suaedae]MBP3951965.1 AAA family ATPase [Bacillus suaedae]
MTNIHSVRLENFQSHLDSYIEFDKGLNVLVGQSDSGKTAVLRGIRWALYNQPRGTDFIRVSGDFVRVTVTFDNGTEISRERTSSKNRYTIRQPEKEDLILEGFGIHVPIEVLEAHGMGHMRIDTDHELSIHLSQQLDGPFLLEQTSSVRAKTLGRISGAHFLDMAIRETTKDVSQLNQRMKREQEAVDSLKEELQPYASVPEMKEKLNLTEENIKTITQLVDRKKTLEQLRVKKLELKTEEEFTTKRRQLVQNVDQWERQLLSLENKIVRFKMLDSKAQQKKDLTKNSNVCMQWIKKTDQISTANQQFEWLQQQVSLMKTLKLKHSQSKEINEEERKSHDQNAVTLFLKEIDQETIEAINVQRQRLKQLSNVKSQLQQIVNQRSQIDRLTEKLPSIEVVMKNEERLSNKVQKHLELQTKLLELRDYEKRMENGKRYIQLQINEQEEEEQRLQQYLIEQGSCPTCGQSICKHDPK